MDKGAVVWEGEEAGEKYVGMFVGRELAVKILERSEERGWCPHWWADNPAAAVEGYIIELVSEDIGQQI